MLYSSISRIRVLVSFAKAFKAFLKSFLINLLLQEKYSLLSIQTLDDVDYSKQSDCWEFGDCEINKVDKPPITKDPITWEFKGRIGEYSVAPPKVALIKEVDLLGPYATGFDRQGSLIWETALPKFYGIHSSISVRSLIKRLQNQTFTVSPVTGETVDLALSLLNTWHQNYFHWFLDCLTKLEGLQHFQEISGLNPQVIVGAKLTRWQRESLSLLGCEDDRLIHWPASNQMNVKQLVITSFRRSSAQGISPSACHFLREQCLANLAKFPTNLPDTLSKRILISRRKANRRRVINEEELAETLATLGFQSYVLEDLSVPDQVRLFSQAEFVVGPHGAGMTNMIFSQNLKIVEFFPGNSSYFQPIFFSLSQALNFRYGYVIGEKEFLEHLSQAEGIQVAPQKLLSVIEQLL